MQRLFSALVFSAFFFVACSSEPAEKIASDSTIADTSLAKKSIIEDLKPSTDIKQFNWMYSAFVGAASGEKDELFNAFIHPTHGLWIIHSDGAMPQMKNIKKIEELKKEKSFYPIKRDDMICTPSDEPLPEINCDAKKFWSKLGCFTQLSNAFKTQKIWEYAGLTDAQSKAAVASAETISRTLINTENYRFYFSLIDGSWYLTFIDVRKPCNA
ncbi:MAG: hypothetical protein ACRCYO_00930 [Bacteroidia bacterium]